VKALRLEFVTLAHTGTVPFGDLCDRYDISRPTGYKWIDRFEKEGAAGLEDRSRRPSRTPRRSPPATENAVVAERLRHPVWGARKIRKRLQSVSPEKPPAKSTITAILHRHGLIRPEDSDAHRAWNRFEYPAPNDLWQMDFKGPVVTRAGPVHPLTILDDHSRFSLGIRALLHQKTAAVQDALVQVFRQYGLPDALLVDNGGPWSRDENHEYTALTVWLLHVGVAVSHSRPYHPQTVGKDERFHRTLKEELLEGRQWLNREQLQKAFDEWRPEYNFRRPHEALGLEAPISRYRPSLRAFPETLPPMEYPDGIEVRRVQQDGVMYFKGREILIGRPFRGYPVGLRPTSEDGVYEVLFRHFVVAQINLKDEG
jgi:transposase InsO family protein